MQKFLQMPGLLVMLDEMNASYRQIFTDGRPLPADPVPAWNGWSSAMGRRHARRHVERIPRRPVARHRRKPDRRRETVERIRRPDYGHIEIELTVDDPKAYTKPWTVKLTQQIVVDTDLIDEICLENEKSSQHMLQNK